MSENQSKGLDKTEPVGMKKLITGLREFKSTYVSAHQDLLEHFAHGQTPRVLFITCSDSRLDPNLLTNTDLGDLFVIRNAGNIIPPYGAANGGEGASVEYAIHALGIEQIVVCGHSHCGAMKGLLQLGKLEKEMPLVYDWLKHAEATRRLVQESYEGYNKEELLEITIAENVLTQIENLKTYPIIHSRLYQGKLKIYGWIYSVETGEVLAYDSETHAYVAPQSQVSYDSYEREGPVLIGTLAPLSCEVPTNQPQLKLYQFQGSTSQAAVNQGSANGNNRESQDSFSASWLSPEQAERIYRGTAK